MDKVNKQELRRLAECASSGPWLAEMEGGRMNVANEDWYLLEMHHDQPLFMTDAAFIAAANPAAILSLLDELERLERDNSSLRQDVRNAFDDDLKLATMRDQEAAIMKLEQYRKDALRYRWLRNEANNCPSQAPAVVMLNADCKPAWDVLGSAHRSLVYGNHLDAAVDDLLAKEGGANG